MNITGFDHIVLCVRDLAATRHFYTEILGMREVEERPGKFALHFGSNKISLQDAAAPPEMARGTLPGTGNFCVLTDTPIARVVETLNAEGIQIIEGPAHKVGATGTLNSVYFRDPDGNLVEVSNLLD